MKNGRRVVFVPIVFAFLVVAIIAMIARISRASIPGANGVITGCILASQQVRIIDTAITPDCNVNETLVTWNQTGPTGSTGPTGPQGVMGLQGLQGVTGPAGAVGPQGPAGSVGPQGTPGISRATFGFGSTTVLPDYTLVASKILPAGSWAIQANAIIVRDISGFGGLKTTASDCQLRKNGIDVIGGAADQRASEQLDVSTLPMNGGIFVDSGTATVEVWCRGQYLPQGSAQIMAMQVGSFF